MGDGACTIIHADDTQTTKRNRQNIHDKTCRRRDVPRWVSTTRWVVRGDFHAVGLYSLHIYNAYVSARQYMPTIHKRQNMHGKTCRYNWQRYEKLPNGIRKFTKIFLPALGRLLIILWVYNGLSILFMVESFCKDTKKFSIYCELFRKI